MNAKKSHRICAPDRTKSAEDVAQHREYARNYTRIRKAVGKLLDEYWDQANGNQFSDSINRIVNELVGCRITEIGDGNIETALACVNATRHLIRRFNRHCVSEAYRRGREQQEREHAPSAYDAGFIAARAWVALERASRRTPHLAVVPNCGSLLKAATTPTGPRAA